MAVLTLGPGLTYDFDWQNIFQAGAFDIDHFVEGDASHLTLRTRDANGAYQDFVIVLEGTGFTYGDRPGYSIYNQAPLGGVVTKVTAYFDYDDDGVVDESEKTALTFTGLNVSLDKLFYRMFDYDDGIASHRADGWAAVSLLLSGNDTIQVDPLSGNNRVTVGTNRGNDKFLGTDHDEVFDGNAGRDLYDGKGGTDTLSFLWRTYEDAGARGITLDAIGKKVKALGTVKDPWGGADTFKSIEKFEGTLKNDVMKGANQSTFTEWFTGFEGNDTIDGRKGFDAVDYSHDFMFPGGLRGIVANLADKGYGTIRDGFGSVDKVINVEMIVGTPFADVMNGNKFNNTFIGLMGDDVIDGKGGTDTIDYARNEIYIEDGIDGDGGIAVELSAVDGDGYSQINDGLGGFDKVKNVENVVGTSYADSIAGNAAANVLDGGLGTDTLDGGLGNDTLDGGLSNDGTYSDGAADTFLFTTAIGPDNVDTIRNFETGKDSIVLDGIIFAGLAGGEVSGAEFQAGFGLTESSTAGVFLVYDQTTGNLYYDADHTTAGAVLFARVFNFYGNPSTLVASDLSVMV